VKPILEIQNISKTFRINHEQTPYLSMRDAVSGIFKSSATEVETFYALRDISFSVQQGDTIGIVGKNGAGKSTLLKILSRITPPTAGQIKVRGRIASLLEVGTGFHPELTGRENIFMNGSILGMKRSEINSKFDQIVEFSGTGKFLDTPLKHYSSGMQLRLAFSVAAFLEPEILIIDEVLAVGDVEFQQRCMGKMEDVSKSGRTILFVSHNMGAVQALCKNSIYLQQGQLKMQGPTGQIIQTYLNDQPRACNTIRTADAVKRCAVLQVEKTMQNEQFAEVTVRIHSISSMACALDLRLSSIDLTPAGFGSLGTFNPKEKVQLQPGDNIVQFRIPTSTLANGLYYMSIDLTEPDKEYYDRAEQALLLEIANQPIVATGRVLQLDWKYGTQQIQIQKL
jgi:lipopolysaccharide transport system ATP-binding protein